MWFIGAVVGALLASEIHSALWIVGALLGAMLGWGLGRRARQEADDRFRAIDQRLRRLEAALEDLQPVSPLPGRVPEQDYPAVPVPHVAAVAASQAPGAVPEGDHLPSGVLPVTIPKAHERPRTEPAGEVAKPVAARPATPPQRPSPIREWLVNGNMVARAGIVILFFGVAFLLKYSYAHIQVPIELRLAAVALGAGVLLGIGWRLRRRREAYALALQGGGVGLLYLTIFGALRLFGLLQPAPAFALLLAVVALSAVLAVLQDSLALAVLGAAGGFLAPILASSGAGSHVALFGYYALLNAGILAIAWFKAWRVLNVLGFAFTFGIATVWGGLNYRPEVYATTQPFSGPVLPDVRGHRGPLLPPRGPGTVERHLDTTLVFGVPLVAFGLQVGLVQEIAYGSAYSALTLGAFYLLLARSMWASRVQDRRLLVEAFLALGTVFATLAIPLAFDGRWTSAAWALEGRGDGLGRCAAATPAGAIVRHPVAVACRKFLYGRPGRVGRRLAGSKQRVPGRAAVGGSRACSARGCCSGLGRRCTRRSAGWAYLLLGWGVIWWGLGGLHEIDRRVRYLLQGNVALAFFTASCLSFGWLARRLAWPMTRYPALALLPLMVLVAMASADHDAHPFAHFGYLAWPLAFAGQLFLLRRHEAPASRYLEWQHAVGLWLLAALGAWEASWAIDSWVAGRAAWPLIAWALFPGSAADPAGAPWRAPALAGGGAPRQLSGRWCNAAGHFPGVLVPPRQPGL
jgi:hypothetical protein